MNKINNLVKDILYVSKLTKTKNKKVLIITSISLSQVSAGVDLLLIATFASTVASQLTNVEIINSFLQIIDNYRILIVLLVILRYTVTYLQSAILKKIEFSATVSLRVYLFSKVLEQKNFSTADSWYYINTLSTHIAFFYSNFAQLLKLFFASLCIYRIFINFRHSTCRVLRTRYCYSWLPVSKLLSASRKYIKEEYDFGADANKELVNVLENLPLIKILRMEEVETNSFFKILSKIYSIVYKNFQVQLINAQLPNFFTLFIICNHLKYIKYY